MSRAARLKSAAGQSSRLVLTPRLPGLLPGAGRKKPFTWTTIMQTTLERPAESAGELYYPTPVTPEEAFQAIGRLHMEPDDPAEPALGSLDGQADQTRWAAGGRRDLEQDLAESGIVDLDGLLEQVGCGGWQGARTGMV